MRTVEELETLYNTTLKQANETGSLIKNIFTEIQSFQKQIMQKRLEVSTCIDQLQQKALRPQSYGQKCEFLKEKIQIEELDKKPGWAMRVSELKDEQEQLEICIISFKDDSRLKDSSGGKNFDNYVDLLFKKQDEMLKDYKDYKSAKELYEYHVGKQLTYYDYLK